MRTTKRPKPGAVLPSGHRPPSLLAREVTKELAAEPLASWPLGRGSIPLEPPLIVGILNVTPDSFSDGGRYLDSGVAVEHAVELVHAGAAMIDIGAESTRPGRPDPVSAEEEWRRLAPVLAGVVRELPNVPVSIDTVKGETALRALAAGAWAINDVSGLRHDRGVADACAAHDAGLILMHSRGSRRDMATYDHAVYDNVTAELIRELERSSEIAQERGVDRERIVLDPGLGFAKEPKHNYEVLRNLPALVALGYRVMVGPSRKRFLGTVTGRDVDNRDAATAAACAAAYLAGAALFRVHAVAPTHDALAVARAVRGT